MASPTKVAFVQVWPKWLMIIMGIIEVIAVIVFFLTELGNVATNFWVTNVFAGGWCGCIMIIHFLALFITGCCAPGLTTAFITFLITIVALIACTAMVSFDAVFIALPSTCILTPSCADYASSTTMFSYYFQQSFFNIFNNLGPFQSYTQTQAKFLFQLVQLCVGGLCIVLCLVYIIVYLVSRNRAKKIAPAAGGLPNYPAPQPTYPQQQRPSYNPQPTAPPAINRNPNAQRKY
ncbi:unnamed protein product [Adineta steineri]|uniref:Uncharacterized protein n=1 Tax=Adineta steineri TaxID=433720 RepID=A0A814GHC7_9BILA|nr:unnamed protein product [Adineta steineri]CAF3857781.1 unnamed protein product [Adineta steineri]